MLYFADIVSGGSVSYFSLSTVIFYVVERYNRFNKLPVFTRRKHLSTRIDRLRAELSRNVSEQSKLQNEPARLSQLEAQEKGNALRDLQEKELAGALSKIDISRLADIKGIGPYVISNLRSAGVYNASQLRQKGIYGVRGIGPQRLRQIHNMLSSLEVQARRQISKALPSDIEAKITSKYAQQRQAIVNHLTAVGQKIAALRAEISQSEWEFRQLYVPSFSEFLRHNF